MISRRIALATSFAAILFAGSASFAADQKAYSDAAFAAARDAGKPILIDITASWCPTCKAQRPILGELAARPEFKDLVVLEVDFDNQVDVVKKFGAQHQSTLITFKGSKETSRSVGNTNRDAIAKQLGSAI